MNGSFRFSARPFGHDPEGFGHLASSESCAALCVSLAFFGYFSYITVVDRIWGRR